MENRKQVLNKLLFPKAFVILLGIPVSAALLFYVFAFSHENEPIAYFSYAFSAYTTVVVCAKAPGFVKAGSLLLHRNRYFHRYMTDIPFRLHLSLHLSLWGNLAYAVMKLFFGVYYRSVWFGTFGVYYTLLTIMRFLLLRHVKKNAFGKELVSELKRYRLCGIILIPMNIALSGVVVLAVNQNKGFEYMGYLIYVVAMYAFYAVAAAVINLIKYRKYQSPVMSAAKVVSLASALVSVLSLETAMLSQFGDSDDLAFRQVMVTATGAGICAVILGTAIFMIVYATKRLERLQSNTVHS